MNPAPMNPERWGEVKRIFLRAAALAPTQRDAYLEESCAKRPDLREHVRSLLESDEEASSVVNHIEGAIGVARPTDAPATPALPDSPTPTPATIGSCRVLSLLGEGASGLVYLGEQARPRRKVAIKVLRPGHTTPAELRRLEREAEIMARLRHPGIANVLESGVERSGPYFMMEYVEGEPITRYARRRELDTDARLRLFLLVCDAVQHAHAMGVIHRDLKPANILVTDAGSPKVLDFGVARAADPDARPGTLATSLGQLVGTLTYMSPEQAGGDSASIDTRADVYALGGILFELLAGMPPLNVHAKPLHEALRIIQFDPPPRLGSLAREFRGDLETIVAKALEKDPARRYASASELASDVRRHLQRLPIHAHAPSTLYELVRFTQRHRPLVAGAAVALIALFGLLGWVLAVRHREHQDYLLAKSLSGSWLPDVMEALAPVPGTYEARRHMLEELREPLRLFAERHPTDRDAQANLAAWCSSFGGLLSERSDFDNALPSYNLAYSILDRLVVDQPGDSLWRLRQSIAAVRVGDLLQHRGRISESQTWYLAALALDLRSVEYDPNAYTARDQLVWSYTRLANSATSHGRFDDAARYTALLETAADTTLEYWPDSPKALYCKVHAISTRAHLLENTESLDAGRPWRERALELSRVLVAREPNNKGYVVHQVFALAHLSTDRITNGQTREALALLAESRPHLDRLLIRDPAECESHNAAVTHYAAEYQAHIAAADTVAARRALASAVHHARELQRLEPHVAATRIQSIDMASRMVAFLTEHATPREARDAACACREDVLTLIRDFPLHPVAHSLLGELHAQFSQTTGDDRLSALEAARHAARLCTPDTPREALRVTNLLEALGDHETAAQTLAIAAQCSAEARLLLSPAERQRVEAFDAPPPDVRIAAEPAH